MNNLPPGVLLMVGALLIPLMRGRTQKVYGLLLPVVSAVQMAMLPSEYTASISLMDYVLTPIRVDALSMLWGYIFHIAAFICVIYQLHVKDSLQDVAGISYAGTAIAAVFAGDLISFFICWELAAVTSVFLIYANGTARSATVGTRYFIIQMVAGVVLLFGALLWFHGSGSLAFGDAFDQDRWQHFGMFVDPANGTPVNAAAWLILFSFGVKAAFPFLHNWMQDSYPEGTVSGTVFLSVFTTKLAIYALARGFAGTELLIPVGVVMTLFPVFFAVIENDLRKVLAYSLNNQLGYMVVGVGVGTQLALNGAASHAFAHILYKSLLFMAMGAVLFRVGTIKGSELGGLYRSMPLTCIFCIVGSLSISGFPLFSGFVTKSMTLSAAFEGHQLWVFIGLLIASAGVVDHSGIKIPFFAFFAHDSGKRVKEAPTNMLVAMSLAAFLCIALGIYPEPLYDLLPFTVQADAAGNPWHNYTASHVVTSLQLLLFASLAFVILYRKGWYPPELKSVNLDFDVVYRKALPTVVRWILRHRGSATGKLRVDAIIVANRFANWIRGHHAPEGLLGDPWSIGLTVLWSAVLLGVFLLLAFL